MASQNRVSKDKMPGTPGHQVPSEAWTLTPEDAQHLRQRFHDGLCQQLAGTALLQGALVKRLEKLEPLGTGITGAATADQTADSAAWQQIIAEARQVGQLLHGALEETRTILRELG